MAREYTRPVILCRQAVDGACSSSIGAFIVVNDEGWVVTAGHILDQLNALLHEERATQAYPQALAAVAEKNIATLREALVEPGPDSTQRASARWGATEALLVDTYRHPHVDLAVGRLEPFDSTLVRRFPVFKNPELDFEPGVSLCKYGFPFHSITPTWNAGENRFEIPADPLPMFPIEGIFTRTIEVEEDGVASGRPLMYVETSSPGLRGQSGGPTFDVEGAIWAIQSQTQHYALGFNPPVPGAANGESEHQFLNVGWGVHAATVIAALEELSVLHAVSDF